MGHAVYGKFSKSTPIVMGVNYYPEADHIIVKNMYEPIIDEKAFEIVQRLQGSKKRPNKVTGSPPLFSGLLKCSTCGAKLRQKRYAVSRVRYSYICHTNSQSGKRITVPIG